MSTDCCSVLLITTRRWHSCARLAMAFSEAGCRVSVVCPAGHSVLKTSVVSGVWLYRAVQPLKHLAKAITSAAPDLVVPCDDAALSSLHELARGDDAGLRTLIESSLGSESSYEVSASRSALHELCQELKIRVPQASSVRPELPLERAMVTVGLPAFLKTDGSSGGRGVCLIETPADAKAAYRKLTRPPSLLRATKRAMVDGDLSLLPSALSRRQGRLSLQQAVTGTEANSTIFCWRGEVMARITVEVVVASMKHGPSTVVRRIESAEIDRATSAIARRLGLSGLCGFDFIVEEMSGQAMLIEMNARPTQTSHLALGEGRDLAAAGFAALTGRRVQARALATRNDLIALFPGELQRDRSSEYLELGYHDVPESEPELLRVCLRRPGLLRRMMTVQGWKRVRDFFRVAEKKPAGSVVESSRLEPVRKLSMD